MPWVRKGGTSHSCELSIDDFGGPRSFINGCVRARAGISLVMGNRFEVFICHSVCEPHSKWLRRHLLNMVFGWGSHAAWNNDLLLLL